MTVEQAIETLKNYECVCKYGTSPINCTDTECDFGKAIKTLTVDVDLNEFVSAIIGSRLKQIEEVMSNEN